MKKLLKISAIFMTFLTLILGIFLGRIMDQVVEEVGLEIYQQVTQLTVPSETKSITREYYKNYATDYDEFSQEYIIEEYSIKSSSNGHQIPLVYIHQGNHNQETAILIHGLGGTKYTTYPVARFFLNLGYNVMAYDQMNSGDNGRQLNSLGVLEAEDSLDLARHAQDQFSQDQEIVLWGTSYGSLTAAIALGKDQEGLIDYAVLDSPLDDPNYYIENEFEKAAASYHVPVEFLEFAGNKALDKYLGIQFSDMDGLSWIEKSKIPVLLIASTEDELTPYQMAENYLGILGNRGRLITVDSPHSSAYLRQPEAYQGWLAEFLDLD